MRSFIIAITCVLFSFNAWSEVVDRIAVAVGNHAIKESQIDRDLRLTAFLNGAPLDTSAASRKKAADHLIDQTVIRSEMVKGDYPAPSGAEVAEVLANIKKARFKTESEYQQALKTYGIAEPDLKSYIAWQVQVLRFIDLRFEPAVRNQAAANTSQRALGERVNESFFAWLDQSRRRVRIQYHDEVFQ